MKKHFLTGLAILLPSVLTVILVMFIINFLTKPFIGIMQSLLIKYDIFDHPFLFFSGSQVLFFSSKLLALFFLIGLTLLLGFIGRIVLFNYVFKVGDYIIHRIPIINKIYKAIQDVTHTIFKPESKSFTQAVLVRFPHSKTLAVGLISSEKLPQESDLQFHDLISVFVPGTPNPSMGFMLMYKREQLIFLDAKVEDAFKFVVSAGVIAPNSIKPLKDLYPQDISAT